MITLMGSKDIFKTSTFPKRKRKQEQTGVAKPRSLKYKPSVEALNILSKQTNPPDGPQSESDTSFDSIPNQSHIKADESFGSHVSQTKDKASSTETSPTVLPPGLSTMSEPSSMQSPILPHISIGQGVTLPSRNVGPIQQPVVSQETTTRPQSISQHLPEQQQVGPPLQLVQGPQMAHQVYQQPAPEPQVYYASPQHQQSQSFQPIPQTQAGPYPSNLIPLQQIPGAYVHNQEVYPYYQQQQHQLPQPQYVPIQMANYYQQPIPSSSSAAPLPHQIYYNVVPYTIADPFSGIHGFPRKSKSSSTWSADEDKVLRELKEVQKLGWREISTFFHERTPNACQFRWRRIISNLDVNSKGPETPEKEKDRNVSSISETHEAGHNEERSQEGSPLSKCDSTDKSSKQNHHQTNKIDFLLN
ncbi:hypothetical protein I9W82_002687 [Candida metapsilosis]|uniref:Myb-like domain-containing protein n=1 Tax=Candida metapsilosis TaxID=273372 RepID=A0A8H7ZIR8_9ASCO|nr:hypothetical protein I9W82_002687 [Candida metapsilosis]